MERKTVALVGAKVQDAGHGSFSGYASVWNDLDLQGDRVAKGAYTATLPRFRERGFIAWSHDWSNPIAMITAAREDDKGLWIAADFHSDPDAQRVRTRVRERLDRGQFMGLSIGYEPVVAEPTPEG